MANNRFYMSLPTQAPSAPRSSSGSRRPPLTPSTVSSPSINTHAPVATRRDSGSGSPNKASSLLAKVACHPTTPKRETPLASPMPSPSVRSVELHSYAPKEQRPQIWRSESARYYSQSRHADGYISFPDYEKFYQTQHPYETAPRREAVKT